MFTPPSVNQITSAYTGHMPQLAQRVEADKKSHGGIPQDLRQLLALNDMTQNGNNAGIQAALQQPQNPPTVAQSVQERARQSVQAKQNQMAQQQDALKKAQEQMVGHDVPPGTPTPPMQEQGIDRLQSNIGQEYSNGGIISFAEGEDVPERDILRRMEAAAYDQTNPTPSPVPQTAEDVIYQGMRLDPAVERAKAEARRNAIQRDTSSMDELKKELLAQRERLNGPKPGMDSLMEYLAQVAAAPRGRTWMESGAAGARAQNELNMQRQDKQHELTKQMLEMGQKKADIGYQQKMDVYGAGESAEAAAIKERYAAAINRSTNEMEKQKLAQQMDMELKKLEQSKELSMAELAVRKQQVAAMNKPETYQKIYSELQRLNPGSKQEDLLKQALSLSGLSARQDSADAQLMGKMQQAIKDIEAKPEYKFLAIPGMFKDRPAEEKALRDQKAAEIKSVTDAYAKFGLGPAQGLPDLNKANPDASTAAPGKKDYSSLWK
jgi:hypothetical protein